MVMNLMVKQGTGTDRSSGNGPEATNFVVRAGGHIDMWQHLLLIQLTVLFLQVRVTKPGAFPVTALADIIGRL